MRTDFEQKLIDLILQDKYADTKMEQIKQAFIDEGWMSGFSRPVVDGYVGPDTVPIVTKAGVTKEQFKALTTINPGEWDRGALSRLMTGPEWHTRFNREYSRGLREEEAMSLGDIARHAAGRACGCIQENE